MIQIERRQGGCGFFCGDILSELPEWFGMAEANESYRRDAEVMPTWLALDGGAIVGIMILTEHEEALEVWLLAVRRERRNSGIGRALIGAAETETTDRHKRYLTVKTRGPSAPTPSPEYDETRAFYRACGFAALEEFKTLWNPENPALFMAKAL